MLLVIFRVNLKQSTQSHILELNVLSPTPHMRPLHFGSALCLDDSYNNSTLESS